MGLYFWVVLFSARYIQVSLYSENCLNRIALGPIFVFGLCKYNVYSGLIYKYFLQ